jgi:hypothetical protein
MAWRRRPLIKREVVFAVHVDYTSDQKRAGASLRHDVSGDMRSLERDLRAMIEEQLPRELSSFFGIEAKTHVIDTKYTSLTMLFGALLAAYPLISSYHDFSESVHLIRKHCATLLAMLNSQQYGDTFTTSVEIYYPPVPDPTDYPYRWMRHMFGHPEGDMFAAAAFMRAPAAVSRRDLFFWYLVVMNIVLSLLLASLVYRSVVATYFDRPSAAVTAPASQKR